MSSEATAEAAATDVPVEAPSGTDLVVHEPGNDQEVLAVVDRHDEAMIVEELQRRALSVMLYDFNLGGGKVIDLSYLGVNEAVRVMNDSGRWQVTIDAATLEVLSVEEDLEHGPEPCWQATVYAVNARTGYGQFGTYTQPKRMKLKDASAIKKAKDRGAYVDENGYIADKFSRQKAVNKAQRNALRIHIPEQVRQTLIAQYEGDEKRIKRIQVGAGAESLAELPPPLTDERAEAQKASARRLYDELREVSPLKLTPAAYHAYLTRAEHDHDRLAEFNGYLQDRLSEARNEAAGDGDA